MSRPARWCCCTAAAWTSPTSIRCSTRSTPRRDLAGATPRAPLTLPPGGHHWYIVERVGFPHRETFMESFALLTQWLAALADETGVPWERTVIGGFSQGAVMAYALALATGRPSPAGLLAMSGFIPEVEGFELDLNRPGLPIAITHGTLDPVIGVEFGRAARQRLEAAGNQLLYRESPVGHGIDPAVLPGPARVAAGGRGACEVTTLLFQAQRPDRRGLGRRSRCGPHRRAWASRPCGWPLAPRVPRARSPSWRRSAGASSSAPATPRSTRSTKGCAVRSLPAARAS